MSRFHKVLLAWLTCCVFGWIVLSPTAVGQDNNNPDQSAQIVQCVEDSIASSSETVAPSAIIVIPPGECHTFKPRLYYVRSANDLQEIRSQSDVPNIGNKRILLLIHGWSPGKDSVRCRYDPLFLACTVSPDAPKERIIETWGNFINFFYSDAAKTLRNHFALFAVRYNSNNHPYNGRRSSLDLDTTYGEKPSGGQLAELLDYLGNRELVIVAYSMGGLVARSYMAEYGGVNRTLGLITLGTPHHGSAFASPLGILAMTALCRVIPGFETVDSMLRVIGGLLAFLLTNTPGAQDLAHVRFGNPALENLEGDTDSKTVSFYGTIKKRVTHGRWYFLDKCLQAIGFQQSDGVVDAESARANFSEDHIIYFEDYDHHQMRIGKGNDKCPDGVTATSKSPCLFVRIRDQICAFADLSCVNRPPIANAGPDQTVQVGSPVQLDGSSSTDPDGDPIKSYRWNILPRENSAQCVFKSSRNIAQPTIQPRREGRCTIELVVSDGKLNSAPDQVTITARKEVCKFKREIYWIGQPPEGVSQTLIDPPTPPADASVRFSLCVEETQDALRWVYTVYNLDFRNQEGINGLSGVRIENKFSVPFSNQFGPPGWVMQGFTSEWEWDIPSGQGIPKGGSAQFGFVTAKDVGPTQSDCCHWVHSWNSVPLQVDILGGGQMLIPGPVAAAASQATSSVGVSSTERGYSFGLPRGSTGVKDFSVMIFDLSGRLVFRSDWVQNGFTWNLLDSRGQPLANGVYLYVVRVRGFDGREYASEVRKLVILR